ncbi:splicing factor 3B subunit 1 [Trichonephila inaurata madagascariensis]|uniref:Splicing factor 3B subunit 1 n=1 Tax=Trichonephila inaurata madagascariensis TaxID=2747483 RepID=A0A8X6ILI5_9ARAC|nr:splicing factor 3B subunit 1 [Trichonephila inaurata madagascariensis]
MSSEEYMSSLEKKINNSNWRTNLEIEAQIRELQNRKANLSADGEENGDGVPLTASAGIYMDEDIYGGAKSKYEGYVTSIAANDEADADGMAKLDKAFHRDQS